MCGIVGFISSNRHYNGKEIVSKMLINLQHRGPDQTGIATYNNNVTVGMTRLCIIDSEIHTIPYTDQYENYSIVYNGEIYNHDTIKSSLIRKYHFKTDSDAETALISFIDNGIQSFNHFNGMYAFAIHNIVNNETYIVRDKAGEKPLYYLNGKDYFAFSSEIKALFEIVEPQVNKNAISYKAYEFTVGKETLFKDIFQLEPGEYIKYSQGKMTIHSYWKIWDNLIDIKDNKKQITKDLAELIENAILLRTKNCSQQMAAFISGGLDSALVACIAKPDYIYTAHYDYPDFDELEYAKIVANRIGKRIQIVQPQKMDFIRTKHDVAYYLDTPCTWTSFTLWMLMEKAKEHGNKVIMTGDGADEIFGGYHRYLLLYHDEQIHNLQALQKYSYLINRYYGNPVDRYARLVNRNDNIYDKKVNSYLKKSIGYYFNKEKKDIVHFMGLNDYYSSMQVLLQMSDRMSMAFSIENRSPFLDYRLVQFAFSLPPNYKVRNGVTKWILKEVAYKFIPKAIVNRIDKRGFSAPVNRWFEWDKNGKYDRSVYRKMALKDWKKVFKLK